MRQALCNSPEKALIRVLELRKTCRNKIENNYACSTGDGINDRGPGPNDFDKPEELFDTLMKTKYTDPTLRQLNLPDKGWQGLERKYQDEQALFLLLTKRSVDC